MKSSRILLTSLLITLAGLLHGQNLLRNTEFNGSKLALPFWTSTQFLDESAFKRLPGEGPDGKPALSLDMKKCKIYRQTDLKLVSGEKYRIGCHVRTENLVCRNNGPSAIVVYDYGWNHDVRTAPFPKDTHGQWVLLEREVTMPPSSNGIYTFAFYSDETTGKLDICNPFVIPVSEKAKAESESPAYWQKQLPRITPYYPTLHSVNSQTGEIHFNTIYPVEGSVADYTCIATVTLGNGRTVTASAPFDANGNATVKFGNLPEGQAKLHVDMRKGAEEKPVLSNDYSMAVITPIAPSGKRLNNFVRELFRGKLENKTYTFTAYEEGWYRFAFSQAQKDAVAFLDDGEAPVVEYRDGEDSDTMRLLAMGRHKLIVKNARPGAELTISRVPELHYYPFMAAKYNYDSPEALATTPIVNRFTYNLDYYKKTSFHLFNTLQFYGGWYPNTPLVQEADREIRRRGIRLLGNGGFDKKIWSETETMVTLIKASKAANTTSGICLDESGPNDPLSVLLALTEMGWSLQDYEKQVLTWLALHDTSYFSNPEIHRPLYAGVTNASRGYGKALLEVYASSVRDETVLNEYMQIFPRQMEAARACVPDAEKRSIIMMGGYIMPGTWCCNPYPQTDIKVFLDEFFHLYATHPSLRDLAGFGCYGALYCDEENHRWLNLLFKHYCVEGNKDKLSERFGFTYNPGHVKSCDFENGLQDWNAVPAEKDSILPRTVAGLGTSIQHRRSFHDGKNGDTCVQLTRSAKAPNKISQCLTGLTPGKLYSLTFVTEDADDIAKAKNEHQPVVLDVHLENCDIVPEKGYHFRLPVGWNGSWGQTPGRREVTTRKIVFRPKKTNAVLTFSDWKTPGEAGAPIGQKQLLNYIAVRPYFN